MTLTARRIVDALTYWGLVSGAVLSCSAGLATDVCACSKSKAYVTAMKSDLRNMVSAQESYFADHGRYAVDSVLRADGYFRPSTGVTVSMDLVDAQRWRARASHVAIGTTCSIEGGSRVVDGSELGNPRCESPSVPCRPNGLLNVSGDMWLFAFTVRRRQRRRRTLEATITAETADPSLRSG